MRDELIELLKKEPFRAFRILLAGGHAYEVHNPDMLVVERDIATHYGKGELY